MNENDMNNLMNQFNQMLKNNDIPGDFKDIIEGINYNIDNKADVIKGVIKM